MKYRSRTKGINMWQKQLTIFILHDIYKLSDFKSNLCQACIHSLKPQNIAEYKCRVYFIVCIRPFALICLWGDYELSNHWITACHWLYVTIVLIWVQSWNVWSSWQEISNYCWPIACMKTLKTNHIFGIKWLLKISLLH